MKISIFGLGYVGAVSAGCLANEGHYVIGVDPNMTKVEMINNGRSPIIEKDMDRMIEAAVRQGRLRATQSTEEAIAETEISFVCVGTPSQMNGDLELKYIRRVSEEIGGAIRHKGTFHVVVIRSTILPGAMRKVVIPTLEERSGKKAGVDFGVCNNPEFLREGSAVYDFYHPPKTVIGETDFKSGARVAQIYEKMDAPLIRTAVEVAEMVKYVDNVWHALKVGFANEIGNICKAINIDGHEVMDIFIEDTKLNISSSYLKPGFAFGGSCLPKDLRALTYKGRRLDLELPILNAILPSNEQQIRKGFRLITAAGHRKIGILGFSFKEGTDDLRESPLVELIERLIGRGYDVRLFDRNVNLASLIGANKDYILNLIPHISKLMVNTIDDLLFHAETIVIGNGDKEFASVLNRRKKDQVIVDLVRIKGDLSGETNYEGICW